MPEFEDRENFVGKTASIFLFQGGRALFAAAATSTVFLTPTFAIVFFLLNGNCRTHFQVHGSAHPRLSFGFELCITITSE